MYHILAISDSHKHFAEAIAEYTKRLDKIVDLQTLKPSRKDDPTSAKKEETTALITALAKKPSPVILLAKEGKAFTSEQFAQYLETHQQQATFVIGGPYGIESELLKSSISTEISFGQQTMPHGLALLVLFEQLRRAQCILQGKKYHY